MASLLLLSGCLGDAAVPALGDPQAEAPAAARPVVIALIDSGVNPYHVAFTGRPGAQAADVARVVPDATLARLVANGSFDERVEQDRAFWDQVELRRVYAFEGTRVLGISFGVPRGEDVPLLDVDGHGTGTASLAAREAPDAVLLSVQVDSAICGLEAVPPSCQPFFDQAALAMEWIAEQSWIDVVSVSMGYPGNAPTTPGMDDAVARFLDASRLAHARGKIVLNAAGNTVAPPGLNHVNGPPWILAVGGFEPTPRGEAPDAAKAPDVVANFSDLIALPFSLDGHRWSSGTSLSTPIVAGVIADALGQVRDPSGRLHSDGPAALWGALNASARLVDATEWDGTSTTRNDTAAPFFRSLPVVFSPAQMGWGYVHGGLVDEIVRRVLEQDLAPPPEKALNAQFMAERQRLREEHWARVAP